MIQSIRTQKLGIGLAILGYISEPALYSIWNGSKKKPIKGHKEFVKPKATSEVRRFSAGSIDWDRPKRVKAAAAVPENQIAVPPKFELPSRFAWDDDDL